MNNLWIVAVLLVAAVLALFIFKTVWAKKYWAAIMASLLTCLFLIGLLQGDMFDPGAVITVLIVGGILIWLGIRQANKP